VRATPLTTTGPQNLHPARAPGRPAPQTRWTKHRGLVRAIEDERLARVSAERYHDLAAIDLAEAELYTLLAAAAAGSDGSART
jgi:hypothetical protein